MSSRGRPAALPPLGWQPPARHQGARIEFISEDGRQRRFYDCSPLPGRQQVKDELAAAFAAATSPLGTVKRKASANALWSVIRASTRWLDTSRPGLESLAELTVPDMRLILQSMRQASGLIPVGPARSLFRYCPQITDAVREELARNRTRNLEKPAQPYAAEELRWITSAARGIIRRGRARLDEHWQLVADLRGGQLDATHPGAPRLQLAQALDRCARHGRAPHGFASSGNEDLMGLLHLSDGEAWAFTVLLAALTGLNASVVHELPAPHASATGPGEPGIALVRAVKWRRGPRAAMTIPLTALRTELHPSENDRRPQHVLNSSLTTPFGVFSLLVTLTAPARAQLGDDRALAFYSQRSQRFCVGDELRVRPRLRQEWLAPVLTGDQRRDDVLLSIHLHRLRKTFLADQRRPVAHTTNTFHRYLQNMTSVRHDGFRIIREALDAQVEDAVARRQMRVELDETEQPGPREADTVLGTCTDFANSPLDDGRPCRQSFLTCLDCANARAFPRHLPVQLLVLDELRARRQQVPASEWAASFAGRAAQLEHVIGEFEQAQIEMARTQTTSTHRDVVRHLFAGDLDPL